MYLKKGGGAQCMHHELSVLQNTVFLRSYKKIILAGQNCKSIKMRCSHWKTYRKRANLYLQQHFLKVYSLDINVFVILDSHYTDVHFKDSYGSYSKEDYLNI